MPLNDGINDGILSLAAYDQYDISPVLNGDQVRALIAAGAGNLAQRWGTGNAPTITFSFIGTTSQFDQAEYSGSYDLDSGIVDWTSTAQLAEAVRAWTKFANITLESVTETSGAVGDIRLGMSAVNTIVPGVDGAAAIAFWPRPGAFDGSDHDNAMVGDIWFDSASDFPTAPFTPGSEHYLTVLHELGHALFGFADVSTYGNSQYAGLNGQRLVGTGWDDVQWTVMSYKSDGANINPQTILPSTPMYLDIIAAEAIYGRKLKPGNDFHDVGSGSLATVYDTTGNDTIRWMTGDDAHIDLTILPVGDVVPNSLAGWSGTRAGTNPMALEEIERRFFIMPGVLIENADGDIGDDLIIGNIASNLLNGKNGNDTLRGGGGSDVLDGGDGVDWADFSDKTASVVVTLNGSQNVVVTVGGAAEDTLRNIENVGGGSAADRLTGDSRNNVLRGGLGGDILNGGTGADTADYRDATGALVLDLATPSLNRGTVAAGDTYISIERLRGGAFADSLYGDANSNTLDGAGRGDWLDGRGGFDYARYSSSPKGLTASLADSAVNTRDARGDTYMSVEGLWGSAFDDILIGDSGDNYLDGAGGADRLDGGAGYDYARYWSASEGVTASLANRSINTGDARGDRYISIEGIRGTDFADQLIGDGNLNTLEGGAGGDVLDGGGGFDYAAYWNSAAGLTVSLADPTINTGEAIGDRYTSIEGLIGSNSDDRLTGNDGSNWLVGGLGRDVLDGQGGFDYAAYWTSPIGLTASLANPAINTQAALGDSYRLIEGLIGSNFADVLVGDNASNRLDGRGGADIMTGGDGNDRFIFTAVTDSGVGAANRDVIADFEDFADDETIDFSAFAGTLAYMHTGAFTGLNQVRVSQSGNDVLVQVNTTGNTNPEMEILLRNTLLAQIDSNGADFLL